MTVANLGSAFNANIIQTTCTITCAGSVSAGTLVVVFVMDTNGSWAGTTVTDSKLNSYSLVMLESGGGQGVELFYSVITNALTTSDTIVYTNSAIITAQNIALSVVSCTGYNTLDPATTAGTANYAATY